jgi:hypothetical protein
MYVTSIRVPVVVELNGIFDDLLAYRLLAGISSDEMSISPDEPLPPLLVVDKYEQRERIPIVLVIHRHCDIVLHLDSESRLSSALS